MPRSINPCEFSRILALRLVPPRWNQSSTTTTTTTLSESQEILPNPSESWLDDWLHPSGTSRRRRYRLRILANPSRFWRIQTKKGKVLPGIAHWPASGIGSAGSASWPGSISPLRHGSPTRSGFAGLVSHPVNCAAG